MDKCKLERDRLFDIACNYQKNYYTQIDCTKDSYFIKREDESYIREYGFETLPELKEELSQMWAEDSIMQECMKVILVSAMKSKPNEGDEEHKHEKLPAYIYNF